ncbi:MAG: epoxyqueuosine reductase [Clostridia bacterium]|nr:epoxyqueuosine reductase [Clostridia bacterium]
MIDVLRNVFTEEMIFLCEALPFSACRILQPHKLERLGFQAKSVIMLAIPYYVTIASPRNLSRYAVAEDYHLFVKELEKRIVPKLSALFSEYHFAVFADNSPIDERHAAVLAGIGVLGDNGLVLTERYGSYVFLAEVLCDIPYDEIGTRCDFSFAECAHCGACRVACHKKELCLSALSQKKGSLLAEEERSLVEIGSVWGCDICQEVCPYNQTPEETPIEFFRSALIPYLTVATLDGMCDEAFARRAYAWRKRETIRRNLMLFEPKE